MEKTRLTTTRSLSLGPVDTKVTGKKLFTRAIELQKFGYGYNADGSPAVGIW